MFIDNQADNRFRMDLQLFNDGAAAPAASGAEAAPAPAPAAAETPPTPKSASEFIAMRKTASEAPPVAPAVTPEPAPAPAEPEPVKPAEAPKPALNPEIIPDKFKNPDGSLNAEALLKSYTNLEQLTGRQGQQLGELNQLKQTVAAMQEQLAQQGADKGMTQEQIDAQAQQFETQFYEKFNENPLEAVKMVSQMLIEQARGQVNEVISPLLEKAEMEAWTSDFTSQMDKVMTQVEAQRPGEFAQVFPALQNVLMELGDDWFDTTPNAMQLAYDVARGRVMGQAPPTPPVVKTEAEIKAELMQSPEFIAELLKNPGIAAQVQQALVAAVKSETAPPVMTGGGQTPSITPPEIRTAKDAGKALLGFLSTKR